MNITKRPYMFSMFKFERGPVSGVLYFIFTPWFNPTLVYFPVAAFGALIVSYPTYTVAKHVHKTP